MFDAVYWKNLGAVYWKIPTIDNKDLIQFFEPSQS